jgi:thioredoxin 1
MTQASSKLAIVMTEIPSRSVNLDARNRSPGMSDLIQHLTDKTFAEAVAQGTTIVDFWAPWCAPCRELAPITVLLAEELKGKAVFAKLNVDDFTPLSEQYEVLSMPTLVVFKDGQPVDRIIGSMPIDQLRTRIQKSI